MVGVCKSHLTKLHFWQFSWRELLRGTQSQSVFMVKYLKTVAGTKALSSIAETVWEAVKRQVLYQSPAVCNDSILCSSEHARTTMSQCTHREAMKRLQKKQKHLTHTKRNKMASCQDGSTGRSWSLLLLCYTSNKSKKKETLSYPSKYGAVFTVSKLWQIHNLISAVWTTREWVMAVCFYQQGVFTQFPNTIKPEDNTCTERLLALLVCQLWNQVPGEGGKTAINYWTSDQPNPPQKTNKKKTKTKCSV